MNITPSILGLAGVSDDQRRSIAPKLKGNDFSSKLTSPASAGDVSLELKSLPLWVRHPGHAASAGQTCQAVISHLDITPSILGLAGVSDDQRRSIAPKLKGKDFSSKLTSPAAAGENDVREGALYNFNMWAYQDAELMHKVYDAQTKGQNPKDLGLSVNLTNRGAIRSVTDGRYRYSRYLSSSPTSTSMVSVSF